MVSDELSVGQEVQVRITSIDKSRRRISLSMKPFVEGEEEGGRSPRREEEDDSSEAMSSNDAKFKMTDAELEALTVEDTDVVVPSTFEAAFTRAAFVQQMKSEGKRFKAKRL